MARMVATKAALSIRVDALTDSDGKSEPLAPSIGIENRAKLESRLRALEHQGDMAGVRRFADNKKQQPFQMTGETKTYNTQADAVDLVPTQREPMEVAVKAVLDVKQEKRRAKEERRAKKRAEKEKEKGEMETQDVDEDVEMEVSVKEDKKDKKRKRRESEAANGDADGEVKVKVKVGLSFLPTVSSIIYRPCRRRQKRSGRRGKKRGRLRRRRLPPK